MSAEIECSRLVISDAANSATVRYTCPASGFGQTSLRVENSRLARIDTQGIADPGSPVAFDPLRSTLAGLAIAIGPGEAYYLPLRHRDPERAAGELDLMTAGRIVERATGLAQDEPRKTAGTTRGAESIASRAIAGGASPRRST